MMPLTVLSSGRGFTRKGDLDRHVRDLNLVLTPAAEILDYQMKSHAGEPCVLISRVPSRLLLIEPLLPQSSLVLSVSQGFRSSGC